MEVLCLRVPKVSVGESLYCFTIVGYRKIWIRGWGYTRFFVENFFPHSAENFRRVVPFSVSRISGIEKVWVRGGGISKFSVGNCLSDSAKNFRRGDSFSVSFFFGYQKNLCIRGLCHDFRFPVENFLSHTAEMFRR